MEADRRMTRSFIWMNAAQFGGALNDNLFKLLVVFFLIALKGQAAASTVNAAIGVLFVAPFLLFLPAAGTLADRCSKQRILLVVKALEIVAMLLAVTAFALRSAWIAYGVVFLMSTQSALFGPTKYGIVTELVGTDRLARANSLLVLYTYLAIIVGTALAPTVDIVLGGDYVVAAVICCGIAVAGWWAASRVERTPAMGGGRRISVLGVRVIWRTLRSIRHDRLLLLAVCSAAYFLLLGGYVQLNLIPFGLEMLGITEQQSAYLFLLAALGIGLGAWSVGRLSGKRIDLGLVPFGMLGVVLGSVGLYLQAGRLVMAAVWIFVLGVSAGFFVVPLEAFIQYRSPDQRRGEILAAKGFLAWIGVLLAAGLLYVFAEVLRITPAQGFLTMGLLTLAWLAAAWAAVPGFRVRTLIRLRWMQRRCGWDG